MLTPSHKILRRRKAIRQRGSLSIARFRQAAPANPKIIGERFATAMLSGDESEIDRILQELAESSSPSESPKEFFGRLSGLLARTAQQAAKLRLDKEELRTQALTDELTGLHNRRGFFALANQQLKIARRNSQHALLFFADVNGLKQINDRLGHSEGDAAVKRTAGVLKRTFRDSDILARLGGDEFAIFAIEAGAQGLEDILRRLKENLHAEGLRDPRYLLSISVGVARFDPQNPMAPDDLLNHADRAMYEAKRNRRDALCSAAIAEAPAGSKMRAPAA